MKKKNKKMSVNNELMQLYTKVKGLEIMFKRVQPVTRFYILRKRVPAMQIRTIRGKKIVPA